MKKIICSTILLTLPVMIFGQSITDGLLVHYKLDGNAIDETPNGFDGTPSGVVSVNDANGNADAAYFFNGVNDYIDLPNDPVLKPDIPFSYSYMVKFEHLNLVGNQMFTSDFKENDYHGSWTTLSTDGSGRIVLSFGGGLGNTSASNRRTKISDATVQTQEWHRLTFIVRGATDMDIYIDCLNAGGVYTGSGPTDVAYSNVSGSIGRMDADMGLPPYYFQGTIDDFYFWDRALSEAEVVSLILPQVPNLLEDTVSFCNGDPALMYPSVPINDILWSTGETTDTIIVQNNGEVWILGTMNGCPVSDTAEVGVGDVSVLNDTVSFCAGDQVQLFPSIPIQDILWSTGETTDTITVQTPELIWVSGVAGFCTVIDTSTVEVIQVPELDLGPDTLICDGLLLRADFPEYDIGWSTGSTSGSLLVQHPGTYWVTIESACGVFSDTISIELSSCADGSIPNVITPNGDGFNDRLDLSETDVSCVITDSRSITDGGNCSLMNRICLGMER